VLFAAALAITAVAPAIILVGWVIGGWSRPSPMPLLIDIVAAISWFGMPFILYALRRPIHRRFSERVVAATAEHEMQLPAGSLRGALELARALPPGASESLALRSDRLLASQLADATPRQLTGPLGTSWRRKRHTALATYVALIAAFFVATLVTPSRSRAAFAPLLHPVRNLKPPALPALVVKPGNASVTRGGSVDVRVIAAMRDAVTLHWRVQGDIAHDLVLPILRDSASHNLSHLDGATEYWVEAADGAASPHYTLTPVDPLMVSELAAEIIYPAYINRANEHYDGELPALELPQGTELLLRGRATRALKSAALVPDSGTAISLATEAATFTARWVPTASGTYSWSMRDASDNQLAVQPPPIVLSIIRDAAPSVTITFPAVDTVFGPELQLPVAAEAQDDHAVASASLVTWRVSRLGIRDAVVETPLPVAAESDRVLVQTLLDASARNLSAGDTLKYFVRVRDNAPGGQVAESRTYSIRLPGLNELRDAASDKTSQLMKANEDLARAAAKLQEDTRNTERRANAANARNDNGSQNTGNANAPSGKRMQFSESQSAQKVLEQQQQLLNNMDEMRAKVEALQKSLENAGLQDADLQQRLAELRKLYDQAMTPEMRQKLDELKKSLDNLDPKQVENALKNLEAQQEQLKKQLERSMQLMQRAAAEQEMNKLTQEAKELSRQEDAHASALKQGQDKEAAARQQEIARRNDELSKELDQLRDQLTKQGESKAASQTAKAGDSTRAAQQSMKSAAQKESAGRQSDAQQDAQKASQQLDDAAKQLDQARQDMVQGWKDETQQSMQQATRDALSLAQRQQALKDQMDRAGSNAPKPSLPQPPQPQAGKQNDGGQKAAIPSAQQGQQPQQGQQGRSGGAGGQQQQPGQQQGGRQAGSPQGTPTPQSPNQPNQNGQPSGQQSQQSDLASMRSEQSALQQGLQQLQKNIEETGDRTAQVSRDVNSAMNRANQSMQQTQNALQSAQQDGQLPSADAARTVDALNKLALSLLKNSQEVQQSKDGTGMQQRMEQMSDLAKQQGSLNGQGSSLMPMNIGQGAMSEQVRKLGQSQQQIAQQLEDVSRSSAKDQMLGRVDELAKEAAAIAQEMQSGRLEPQTLARQEKLFHRLLDAGRSLEKDEVSQERVAEKPVNGRVGQPGALDPNLFKDATKFRAPTPEELRALPPAYRKLILDYFERLNRTTTTPAPDKR
jgi:hypothetical protein